MSSDFNSEDTESDESESSSFQSLSSTSSQESDPSSSESSSPAPEQHNDPHARVKISRWLQRERLFQQFCNTHVVLPTPSQIARTGKTRGYSLHIASVQNFTIPNKLVQLPKPPDVSQYTKQQLTKTLWTVGAHVSLFHLQSCSFFGNTWVSPEIVIDPKEFKESKSESTHISTSVITSVHFHYKCFCLSDVKDTQCFAILELVLYERDAKTKVVLSASGCGWTAIPLFASAVRGNNDEEPVDAAVQSAEVFTKSPRILWELCGSQSTTDRSKSTILWHQLDRHEDCKVFYAFRECRALSSVRSQTLLRKNELVGALDMIPGFKNHNLANIDLSDHPKLLPWIQFKDTGSSIADNRSNEAEEYDVKAYEQALDAYRHLTWDVTNSFQLGPSYELSIVANRVCIHLRHEMEANLIERLRLSRLADASSKFAGASTITGEISARTLKLALHNGRCIRTRWSSIPLKLDHAETSTSSDTLTCLPNVSKLKGFVFHPLMAIIALVQYTVHLRITWSEKKKQQLLQLQSQSNRASGERMSLPEQDVVTVTMGVRAALPSDGTKLFLYDEAATPWNTMREDRRGKKPRNLQLDLLTGSAYRNFTDSPLFVPPNSSKSALYSQDSSRCSEVVGTVELQIKPPMQHSAAAVQSTAISKVEPEQSSKEAASECHILNQQALELTPHSTRKVDHEVPISIRPESRENLRHLSRAAKTTLVKQCTNYRKHEENASGPVKTLTAELKDPLTSHELCFHFPMIRIPSELRGSDQLEAPQKVYFTFQFYRFPPSRTEILQLQPTENPTTANRDGIRRWQDFKILRESEPQQGDSERAFLMQFQVDTTLRKDPFEVRDFALYLMHKELHVDVWDIHSGFLYGSFAIPMHFFLRQGSTFCKQMMEIDVSEPLAQWTYYQKGHVNADSTSIYNIQQYQRGSREQRVGTIQVLLTNFGTKGQNLFDQSFPAQQDSWTKEMVRRPRVPPKRRVIARPAAEGDPDLQRALLKAGLYDHLTTSHCSHGRRLLACETAAQRRIIERNLARRRRNPSLFLSKTEMDLLCDRFRANDSTGKEYSKRLMPIHCDLDSDNGIAALLRVYSTKQLEFARSYPTASSIDPDALSSIRDRISEIHANDPKALYKAALHCLVMKKDIEDVLFELLSNEKPVECSDVQAITNHWKSNTSSATEGGFAAIFEVLKISFDENVLRQCLDKHAQEVIEDELLSAWIVQNDIFEECFHRSDLDGDGFLSPAIAAEAILFILHSLPTKGQNSLADKQVLRSFVSVKSDRDERIDCDAFHSICGLDSNLRICKALQELLRPILLSAMQSDNECVRSLCEGHEKNTSVGEIQGKLAKEGAIALESSVSLNNDRAIPKEKLQALIESIAKCQLIALIFGEDQDRQCNDKEWTHVENELSKLTVSQDTHSAQSVPFSMVAEVFKQHLEMKNMAFDAKVLRQCMIHLKILEEASDSVSISALMLNISREKSAGQAFRLQEEMRNWLSQAHANGFRPKKMIEVIENSSKSVPQVLDIYNCLVKSEYFTDALTLQHVESLLPPKRHIRTSSNLWLALLQNSELYNSTASKPLSTVTHPKTNPALTEFPQADEHPTDQSSFQESYKFHSDPKIRSIEVRIRNAALDAFKRGENPLTLLSTFTQHRAASASSECILLRVELEQLLQRIGFTIDSDTDDSALRSEAAFNGGPVPESATNDTHTAAVPRLHDPLYARQLDRLAQYKQHLKQTNKVDQVFLDSCGVQETRTPITEAESSIAIHDLSSYSREKAAFLRLLSQYRNGRKKAIIYALVKNQITSSITVFPSFGSLVFLHIPLQNPYIHPERFQIQIRLAQAQDDQSTLQIFDVQVIRDVEEWKFLQRHIPPANMPWTAWNSDWCNAMSDSVEKEMIDNDNELIVDANELLYIPFRIRWLSERQQEAEIDILVKSCAQGHIISTIHLLLKSKPFICDRVLRFQHAPNEIWRSTFTIPAGKAVVCMDPNVSAEIIAPSEHAKTEDLYLQCRIGAYPTASAFYIVLYADAYCAQIYEIWRIHVQSVQQLHVHTALGQRAVIELHVRDHGQKQRERRIRCLLPARMQHLVQFTPTQTLQLQPNAMAHVRCHFCCWQWEESKANNVIVAQLNRILLMHVVDVDTLEVIEAWHLHVHISAPKVTKHYDLTIAPRQEFMDNDDCKSRMVQKKIAYRNPWQHEQRFLVRSSNAAYLIPRDKLVRVPAHAEIFLRMLFPTCWPRNQKQGDDKQEHWPASTAVYLFMMNQETLQQEECLCFQITYTNVSALEPLAIR